jgi:hypothetical protein
MFLDFTYIKNNFFKKKIYFNAFLNEKHYKSLLLLQFQTGSKSTLWAGR